MKQGWETKKLGEVVKLTMGQSPASSSYNDDGDGLPFFQGCSDFGSLYPIVKSYCNSPNKIAEPLDVLMSVRAPVGALNISNVKCCIGRGLASFRQIDNISSYKFIFYFLKSSEHDLQNKSTGATFKAVGKELLYNYPIALPAIDIQEKIVSELDLLSNVIDKQKNQLTELDTLAQSIFYDMFGDPVANEKNWQMLRLEEIADSKIGLTYKPAEVSDEGTIVLRSSNIQNSEICLKDIVRVVAPIKERQWVKDGDILMCTRNGSFRLVGKVALIQNLPERMSYGAFMTVIRSEYNRFLFSFFKTPAFRIQLGCAGTATINQITVKMLNEIRVPLPPLSLQQEFIEKIEAIEAMKAKIHQSLKESEELFNSRMDYYFN